jgi:hypothetical protein
MLVRTAFGVVATSALLATSLAPAYAHGGSHHRQNDELRVKVCKYIDNHDDDEEFDIDVWTDEEDDSTTLGHRECDWFRLDYDNNKFWLDEDVNHRDWDTYYRVYGDAERAKAYRGGKLKVWFDDDEDHPYLRINVYNRSDDDHWRHDRDHDDD